MVSGGSAANLAGLTVARNTFFGELNLNKTGLFSQKPFRVYCSSETHNSTDKSVALLGIGTDNLKRIATNEDFTINLTASSRQNLNSPYKTTKPLLHLP
jgi:glutamate/tyrosine decarboxylase-like PLP-dependent enzyme